MDKLSITQHIVFSLVVFYSTVVCDWLPPWNIMKTLNSNVKISTLMSLFSIQIVESKLLPLVNLNVNEKHIKLFWSISIKAQTKLKLLNDNTCLRYKWQLHLLRTLKALSLSYCWETLAESEVNLFSCQRQQIM